MSVVLGLTMALATVLGVASLCAHGPVRGPVAVLSSEGAAPAAHHGPSGAPRAHVCPVPGHDQCGARTAAYSPTTGPGPHPFPRTPPALVDTRPAVAPTTAAARPAAPRAPDLHVLQVQRT
ncbi:hypothetical protein AB0F77_03775 [Streptomyces sp. NPDC026672]|uniref:hypothetical protein n=1 Tax=unclassified Streptomyces TaxID=2593676 RepID=UPI0033FE0426